MSTIRVDCCYYSTEQWVGGATSLRTQIVVPPVLSNVDQIFIFLKERVKPCSWFTAPFQLDSSKDQDVRVIGVL